MKICVHFQRKDKYQAFEGVRLVKSIKGALDIANIRYVRNDIEYYDILHCCSIYDETKINDAIEEGKKVVFSALMSENDVQTRLLTIKDKNAILSTRELNLLNKVDLILVSDELSKKLLVEKGVTTRIDVVPLGINNSRFLFVNEQEDNIFYNYYQLSKETKFIVSIGTYEDNENFEDLIQIAKLCPKNYFYYFGFSKSHKVPYKNKNIPANLKFHTLANEEIYRSMMKNASIYLSFDNTRHSPITLFDAASSGTQIVSLRPNGLNDEILNKLGAYSGTTIKEVGEIINKYFNNELPSNVELAKQVAHENSLKALGKALQEKYNSILKGEENA